MYHTFRKNVDAEHRCFIKENTNIKINISNIIPGTTKFMGVYNLAKRSYAKYDYVKIASYMFLEQYPKREKKEATGVMYNKYMTLLHEELKSGGVDIKLPHCWYRWGDIVVEHCIPYVQWNHKSLDYTTVTWRGERFDYDVKDETISLIKKNLEYFLSNHLGLESHETAKDEVYKGAPYQFQNEYRKLRETLDILCKNNPYSNIHQPISTLFESAMEVFPKEFKRINSQKDEFIAVFRLVLDSNESQKDLFDVSEFFWFFFCYYLRVDKKGHENIPTETLAIWNEKIPWETSKFEHIMENYAQKFNKHDHNDPAIDTLIKRGKIRDQKIDDLISKLFGDEDHSKKIPEGGNQND